LRIIEFTGKTVDDAKRNALTELKLTEDKIKIQVLEEGNKGFLGIIGTKPAKIKVTVKRDYIYEGNKFLQDILDCMDVKTEITFKEENNIINVTLTGQNMGILIGYRGETLDSLQYLLSLIINKGHESEYKRVVLDTENYRLKREETLQRLAEKMASRVKRSGKYIKLEPMNPYERRIIHSSLQNDPYINTYSEGDEPYRRVVVDLQKKA
jgi:spoIIIJ-associated protein